MQDSVSDLLFRTKIADIVADRYFDDVARSDLVIGEMEYRYWSICLAFDASKKGERRGVYVKVPKQRTKNMSVMPFCEQDRVLARNEFDCLVCLNKEWPKDGEAVSFVEPLEFLEEYNAIVLERSYGVELSDRLKKSALGKVVFPWRQLRSEEKILSRIGVSLGRFHQGTKTADQIDCNPIIKKIRTYVRILGEKTSINEVFTRLILETAESLAGRAETGYASLTLNGLRPHSFLIENDGAIKGLDPGKSRVGPPQQDLARMIVALRALFWGKPWSRLARPSPSFEKAFLSGWETVNDLNRPLLSLCIIKQFLRDWLEALENLPFKKWSDLKRRVAKRVYIDPALRSNIRREIAASKAFLGGGGRSL